MEKKLEDGRIMAADGCWNMFPFSLAVTVAHPWETIHDEARRKVVFEGTGGPDPLTVDFVCLFARDTATVLACGLDPIERETHRELKSDLLPTVLQSMKIVRDLADFGRLNPDDRLISGDGEALWHEAKRQEEALDRMDSLIGSFGTNLDKFASLPVIAQRLGAEGLWSSTRCMTN